MEGNWRLALAVSGARACTWACNRSDRCLVASKRLTCKHRDEYSAGCHVTDGWSLINAGHFMVMLGWSQSPCAGLAHP